MDKKEARLKLKELDQEELFYLYMFLKNYKFVEPPEIWDYVKLHWETIKKDIIKKLR